MSPTKLEKSLETIIDIFHQYAEKENPRDQLSNGELSKLVKEQLPNFLKDGRNAEPIEAVLKKLDENEDQQMTFEEFLNFITMLMIMKRTRSHQDH